MGGRAVAWRAARWRVRRGIVGLVVVAGGLVLDHQPATVSASQYGQYCANGAPVRRAATTNKVIAFTFDDGPWPGNTAEVMTRFEQYGWRATFFMIGSNVRAYPDIARSVVARGHTVGNHSMSHQYSPSGIANEIAPTNQLIQSTTGVRTTWFRSPGLTLSTTINNAVWANGMCNISTATDLGDWVSPRASASTLCTRFRNSLKPGEIVLLHDGGSHRPTLDALPCMLDYVRAQGYAVVSLGDLLSGTYTPPPPPPPPAAPTWTTLTIGSRGTTVAAAQRAVMAAGISLYGGADGIYGSYTANAVRQYQQSRGLAVNGTVDQATAVAMGLFAGTGTPPPAPSWTTLSIGSRGATVAAAQRVVMAAGIYLYGGADGIYGSYTANAVRQYQQSRGLAVNGTVDEATAIAMGLFAAPAAATMTAVAPESEALATTMSALAEEVPALDSALVAPPEPPADPATLDAEAPVEKETTDDAVPDATLPSSEVTAPPGETSPPGDEAGEVTAPPSTDQPSPPAEPSPPKDESPPADPPSTDQPSPPADQSPPAGESPPEDEAPARPPRPTVTSDEEILALLIDDEWTRREPLAPACGLEPLGDADYQVGDVVTTVIVTLEASASDVVLTDPVSCLEVHRVAPPAVEGATGGTDGAGAPALTDETAIGETATGETPTDETATTDEGAPTGG